MNKFLFLFLIIFLSGCSSLPTQKSTAPLFSQAMTERIEQIATVNQWQIRGKIAFINGKERSSATLNWRINNANGTQRLNLTSYLGINVLQLRSEKQHHTIEVDGEEYNTHDLDNLIYQLTGLSMPTQALQHWIKAVPYSEYEEVLVDENNLPTQLSSFYQGKHWQINYSNYKNIDGLQLPTKLTIQQNQLTIKISINQWQL